MSKGLWRIKWLLCLILIESILAQFSYAGAASGTVTTFGDMASKITSSFSAAASLVTAGSYIAGIGFSLGAVMKFKQHKDNPTQIPIGTPISMTFIAAALLFFPTILTMSGMSIFGTTATASSTGTAWGSK